jgi:hypothetical protein
LVGNFREGGENFAKTKGLMNEMVDETNTPPGSELYNRILHEPLPTPLSKIPLFDFHFNEIPSAPVLSSRLAIWGNLNLIPQCITMDELKKQKKAQADKAKATRERHAREEAQRKLEKSEQSSGDILSKLENTIVDLDAKNSVPDQAKKDAANKKNDPKKGGKKDDKKKPAGDKKKDEKPKKDEKKKDDKKKPTDKDAEKKKKDAEAKKKKDAEAAKKKKETAKVEKKSDDL